MSLPYATDAQIQEMNKIADDKMKQEEILTDEAPQQLVEEAPVDNDEVLVEEVPVVKNQENQKDYNLRILRERAERAEYEKEEALRYIMSLQQNNNQNNQEDEFSNLNLDDESLVEGKHLREMVREIKNLKSTLKNYERQTQQNNSDTIEVRLQTKYPDFNQVVTQENLIQLRSLNPDLADAILSNKDQYKQAKLAYDMVKNLGIYKADSYYQEKELAQKNSIKPRPLSSISPTQTNNPMSKVNAFANAPLTKELKDQHYQEMLQAMKGM